MAKPKEFTELAKSLSIDPAKGFYQLKILWVGVVIIFSLAFLVGIDIYFYENLVLNRSSEGYNNLLVIYKFPLTVLALLIPYIAFLATTHRSVQAKEQIIASREQNNFSNYLRQIDDFDKFITSYEIDESIRFRNLRHTFKILYPNASFGDFSLRSTIYHSADEKTKVCYDILKLIKKKDNDINQIISVSYKCFEDIFNSLDSMIWDYSVRRKFNLIEQYGHGVNVQDHIANIKHWASILDRILFYNDELLVTEYLEKLRTLDKNDFPNFIFSFSTREKKFIVRLT